MISRLLLLLVVALSVVALEGCATTHGTGEATKTTLLKKKNKKKKRAFQSPVAGGSEVLGELDELGGPDDEDLSDEEDDPSLTAVVVAEGAASYYHDSLAGRPTANGERYNPEAPTCAHRSLPFGTVLLIEDVNTGKQTRCRVNDRGPFVAGRVVDLSRRVARELGILQRGVVKVRLRVARAPSSS